MKIAKLSILALLIVAGAIPLSSAQMGIETGQTAIYCPSRATENCNAGQMVGSTPPYKEAAGVLAKVDLFTAFSATGGQTQKNIMITIKISSPFSADSPLYGQFIVEAQLAAQNAVVRPYRSSDLYFETNPLVPNMVTFTFMSVSRVSVSLYRLCRGAGGCTQIDALVPPGKFFTIEWQIQDPPGNAALSLPFDLLTIIALVTVPLVAAESVYLISLRRRMSKTK